MKVIFLQGVEGGEGEKQAERERERDSTFALLSGSNLSGKQEVGKITSTLRFNPTLMPIPGAGFGPLSLSGIRDEMCRKWAFVFSAVLSSCYHTPFVSRFCAVARWLFTGLGSRCWAL